MSIRIASVAVLGLSLVAVGQQSGVKARTRLEAHLSHGIGRSPFDSDLWRDETNAALIVRARSGATRGELEAVTGGVGRTRLTTRFAPHHSARVRESAWNPMNGAVYGRRTSEMGLSHTP